MRRFIMAVTALFAAIAAVPAQATLVAYVQSGAIDYTLTDLSDPDNPVPYSFSSTMVALIGATTDATPVVDLSLPFPVFRFALTTFALIDFDKKVVADLGLGWDFLAAPTINAVAFAKGNDFLLSALLPTAYFGSASYGSTPATAMIGTTIAFSDSFGPARITIDNASDMEFAALSSAPEPASWAMFIIGFGVMGSAVRRRRVAQGLRRLTA